jgi:hypothetical protein
MILEVVERPHSAISPSGYERVHHCTASHQLVQASRGRGVLRAAGEAALDGTAAHALFEHGYRYEVALDQIEAVRVAGVPVAVTERIRESAQFALDWVGREFAGRPLLIEHRVTLPWGRVAGWIDVATADRPWTVADLKSGYAIVPASSPQLGLYLLGLILEREYSIEGEGEARAIILQPRAQADPVREHTWTYAALRALRDELIETLDRIRRADFTFADGAWCRWCPVAGLCPRLAAVARDAAAVEIGAAPELLAAGAFGAEQLNDALLIADALEHRVRQSWAIAHEYLMAGGKLADFKLVQKPRGGLTVVPRSDRRPEVDVGRSLRLALRSSVAFEYRNAARSSATVQEKSSGR